MSFCWMSFRLYIPGLAGGDGMIIEPNMKTLSKVPGASEDKKQPLISVIIPVYNVAPYLREAVTVQSTRKLT